MSWPWAIATLLALAVAGAAVSSPSPATGLWITAVNPETQLPFELLQWHPLPSEGQASDSSALPTLNIAFSRTETLQSMVGFGAGLPQACAYVLQALKARNESLYWEVMERLFGTGKSSIGMSFVRFPIGSCDFSLTEATYDDVPANQTDYPLAHFAVDAASLLIFDTLRDARRLNPSLVLMAAPWSPPAWLKTGGTLDGLSNSNTLLPTVEAREAYAAYLVDAVRAIDAAGLKLQYLSLQNEPLFGTAAYPGMYFPAPDEAALGCLVADGLRDAGLDATALLAYDHNWNVTYPATVFDSECGAVFAGTAYHCYAGVMQVEQDLTHEAFPEKELHVTECTGGYPNNTCDLANGMVDFGSNHEWDMANLFVGAAAAWSQSGVKWIMALDEFCGPTLPQVSFQWGRPLVAIPSTAADIDDVFFNQDFWTIGHMSKFIPRGALRLNTTQSGSVDPASVIAQAFLVRGADGAADTAVLVVLNMNHTAPLSVSVGETGGEQLTLTVPLWGTAVAVWTLAQ